MENRGVDTAQLARLADPFAEDELEWRLQTSGEKGGKLWALSVVYVTNRAIMNRFDDVVGVQNWRNEFVPVSGGGFLCGISVLIDGEWVTKWDGCEPTDVEPLKGSLSGAMKRAAVQWGIGRYLYSLDEGFAEVSESGKLRGKTKDGKPFRWNPPKLPAWALPKTGKGNESQEASKAVTDERGMQQLVKQGKTEPITDAQRKLFSDVLESHVFSDIERAQVENAIGEGMTKQQAQKWLDQLLVKVKHRKAAEKENVAG